MFSTRYLPLRNAFSWRAALVLVSLILAVLPGTTLLAAEETCVAPAKAGVTGEPIRMVFGGDVVLGNSFAVDDIPESWDATYFAGVRPVLDHADVLFGNLEGVLTNHASTLKKPGSGRQFAFRFPPRYAELLRQTGFNIVNVANNHAFDFGESGFLDTLSYLQKAGIKATGPRDEMVTLTIRGFKIIMIGFTFSSKFNSVFELEHGAELVRQAKAQGAYVIVTFHAGAEGTPAIWHGNEDEIFLGENRGNEVAFAHAMIDAGADMAVGHGPHVLREAECYQGHPIVYSLGNFVGVGGLSAKRMAGISALLEVRVRMDGSVQDINMVSIRFDDRRLPQLDDRAFGLRLVNYLGRHARYAGNFIAFPASGGGQKEFEAWFSDNAEPVVAQK